MTETEFIESIDCQLPYGDLVKVERLIEQAREISSNAMFMVLHEICRPPRSVEITLSALLQLLACWSQSAAHPLCAVLLPIAESMIRGQEVSTSAAMAAMREVALFPNQHCALAIPYFSCDDKDGEVDALHTKITHAWAGVTL